MLIFYQAQLSFLSPDNTGASANQICTDFVPISQLRDLLSCQSTPSILLYQVVTSVLGTLIWMWFNKSVHGTSFTPRWVPNSFYVAHHVKWFTWIFSSGILSLYPCKFHQAMRVAIVLDEHRLWKYTLISWPWNFSAFFALLHSNFPYFFISWF